ncbi:hypothetical protein F4779DRAFT_610148 [Xylariaceae sp. FL0662B]|nr:hypothetical protein F4779DRAFT_610148 [Xylariaceae sp. FL0662B]
MDAARAAESNAYMVHVPVSVFLAICPTAVGTRIWSRLGNGCKLGTDDYAILVSLGFALASGGIMLAACHYGYGRHIKALSPPERYQALKYFYLCQITYKSCINLTKAAILLLYLRIFNGIRWFKWTCCFVLTCVVMYCVASVTATIFQCTPIDKAFDKSIEGACIDNGHFWFANAGFSIATDIIILVIPMPLVYALQIPKVQKIALIMVFTLGVFVLITSCLRITTIDLQATTPDPTYDIASTMWTIIEMNVAVVCACLPQIRPLIMKLFPRLMPAHYGSRDRHEKPTSYGSCYSKSYMSRDSKQDHGKWARVNGKEAMNLTSVRKGDASSEEYMLRDDKGCHIQKTVQYSIEYSKGKESPHI